jgi:hypothetical protein
MTNEEILKQVVWRDSKEARLQCFSPMLGISVEVDVLTNHEMRISERSFQVIRDFLGLSLEQLEKIKQFLWEDCKLCCEVSSYGFDVPDGKDEVQTNHDEFGVHSPDDALRRSSLDCLLIVESDQESYAGNYGLLVFDNEWNSHLTTVVMKDASVVGYGDSGLNIGRFERNP